MKKLQLLIIVDFQLLLASSGGICNVELQQNGIWFFNHKNTKIEADENLGFRNKTFILQSRSDFAAASSVRSFGFGA